MFRFGNFCQDFIANFNNIEYTVGEKIFGYTIDKIQHIPEINALALSLSHDQTKARHLHISCEDHNNTFA